MQKIKGEITYETYLDLVDDFRNEEECHFPFKMCLFEEDPVVVEQQLVTLAPPLTCQIIETSNDKESE